MRPWRLGRSVRVLRKGGVIAYPTEAVYGLGCDPLDAQAVLRLLALKDRPMEKGLILIASDFQQLQPFIRAPDSATLDKIQSTWPGPVTWLLPVKPETPAWLRGAHDTLAVRVTAHPQAAALCRAFGGAIVSTSANPGGLPPARNALQVRRYFGDTIDDILPGKAGPRRKPSEIRDAATGRVVRAG
ncbi:MAG: Sua5/YciO/YrdC/YwlC family protein [Pseudomonadota bacterium]